MPHTQNPIASEFIPICGGRRRTRGKTEQKRGKRSSEQFHGKSLLAASKRETMFLYVYNYIQCCATPTLSCTNRKPTQEMGLSPPTSTAMNNPLLYVITCDRTYAEKSTRESAKGKPNEHREAERYSRQRTPHSNEDYLQHTAATTRWSQSVLSK